jgi:hypothetical protein
MESANGDTCFPELQGEERREADERLAAYLRLVFRIYREHVESNRTEFLRPLPLDSTDGTGRIDRAPP